MTTKTLTIQFNDEQLPILPLEPKAHLSFATHDDFLLSFRKVK